jgi:hypothetical protein
VPANLSTLRLLIRGNNERLGLAPVVRSGERKNGATMRPLTIAAVCLITIVSGPAYVGSAAARGAGWNQVAADAAGRAYAVEGKYSPFNGPCPAPQGSPHAYRTPRLCATQQHEPQTP